MPVYCYLVEDWRKLRGVEGNWGIALVVQWDVFVKVTSGESCS